MNVELDDKKKISCIHIVCIAVIMLCCLWNIRNLDFIAVLNDEFGYWGTAASIAGYNWMELIRETPYYSFGYSLWLVPIMYILNDSVLMYDVAICLNVIFLCSSYCLAYYVGRKLFPEWNKYLVAFSCGATILYSGNIFYSQIAWSETLLYFLMWVVTAIFVSLEECFTYKKTIFFILVLGYMYMVHQRTIGILIVGIVCIIAIMVVNKKPIKMWLIPLVILGICIGGQSFFKGIQLDALWNNSTASTTNDVGFDRKTIGGLIGRVLYNFKDLIKSFGGKIYYLLVSTMLLLPVGCAECINSLIKVFRKKTGYDKQTHLLSYVFIVGAMLAMLGICSIQMINAVERKDILVYSRYMENAMGPLVLISFYGITSSYKKNFKYIMFGFLAIVAGTWFVYRNLVDAEGIFNTVCSPGIGAFFVNDQRNAELAMKYLIIAVIVIIVFWLLLLILNKTQIRNFIIIAFVVMGWICMSDKADDYIMDYRQKLVEEIVPIRDYIIENNIRNIYYIKWTKNDEYSINPKYLQFMIPEDTIKVVEEEQDLNEGIKEGIILTNPNSNCELDESVVLETSMLKVYEIGE